MDVRRTVDEVLTAHELYPELRTVYVEGGSDKAFIDWYVWASRIDNLAVLPIDTIDVDDALVQKHGLTAGSNRSRVLALAAELAERQPDGEVGLLCIADRDFEDYRPCGVCDTYMAFTDYNALELYAFNDGCMRKFVAIGLGGLRIGTDTLLTSLAQILGEVYAIRLANERLGWCMEWLSFAPRYVVVEPPSITLRRDQFIRAYLLKNNRWESRKEFAECLQAASADLLKDPGRRMRGHDLADLLSHVIRKASCPSKYTDSPTLERALMAAIERCQLDEMPLFERLVGLASD